MKQIVKIVLAAILSFVISIFLAFFGYLGYTKTLSNCDFGCGFGVAFAALFYVPVIAVILTLPVYIFIRRLFKIK